MVFHRALFASVLALACALPVGASAQVAAETATVTSGSAGTAKASRSLGNAVSGSVNSAANTISNSGSSRRGNSKRRARRGNSQAPIVIGTGDPLENTDASSYTTGSGATIRVSGSFRPSRTTRCTEYCEDQKTKAEAPAAPEG